MIILRGLQMPQISVQFKKQEITRYAIEMNKECVIGRSIHNQIVIDNIAVSDLHARIVAKGGQFYIEDLNSTNGTFVNKKKISQCKLEIGDVISIGKHELIFFDLTDVAKSGKTSEPGISESVSGAAKTGILETSEFQEMIKENRQFQRPDMSPLVILQFKGKQICKYLLKPNKVITIGRLDDNQITIDNSSVSGHHAQIVPMNDEFSIQDQGSSNGTFVNGKKIASQTLLDNDVISIGRHELIFNKKGKYKYDEIFEPIGSQASLMVAGTNVLDSEKYKEMIADQAALHSKQTAGATLSYIEGGQGKVVVSKKMIKIGKSADSDIIVNDIMVGKTAAMISVRPDGYYLSYGSGLLKPKLNGVAVKEVQKLSNGDVIKLGSLMLGFNV